MQMLFPTYSTTADEKGESLDPIAAVLFAEKQLRWPFILPAVLVASSCALIAMLLFDSGTPSLTADVLAWSDSGEPILPLAAVCKKRGAVYLRAGTTYTAVY
jgi:hypothetical protein